MQFTSDLSLSHTHTGVVLSILSVDPTMEQVHLLTSVNFALIICILFHLVSHTKDTEMCAASRF